MKTPRPTDAELEILNVLWSRGPSTVREVHDALHAARPTGYTTILKLMQIMAEKRLVKRDARERAHVYEAGFPREQTQRQLVGHLLERAFGGSAKEMLVQALSARKATPEELSEIRQILNQFERGAK